MEDIIELRLKNNYIISDNLFFMIIRRLLESDNYIYRTDIEYTSSINDSMMIKICSGENKFTITRRGANDDTIKIHGEKLVIRQFLHDLAIEAVTIIFTELCSSVFKCGHKKLQETIHEKIQMTIDAVFAEQD